MMRIKELLIFVFGALILCHQNLVQGAPAPPIDGSGGIVACFDVRCDPESGPVCAIDASGIPRTFENRCMADLAYCREGRYYVMVKNGEC